MSLCIGLIYQARTFVSTRHLLTTVSDLWAVEMISAASKVGHVLICEACVAVRICQRKGGLSYLVIGQLWVKPWHRAVTLTWGGVLRDSLHRESRYKVFVSSRSSPLSSFSTSSWPKKYIKTVFTSALWLRTGSGAESLSVCVGPGDQAADNRPCGQKNVTLDSSQAPVKLSLATDVIQVSAVSDESKSRNIFPQSRNYTGRAFKPISVYVIARSLGLSIPLLAFAKISPCTAEFWTLFHGESGEIFGPDYCKRWSD